MANIKDLKKDVNNVLGDIIEAVYLWEATSNNHNSKEGSALIDEAIATFDTLIADINNKSVENRKAHLTKVRVALEEKANGLISQLNKL